MKKYIQGEGLGDLLLSLRRKISENIKHGFFQDNLTFSQMEVLMLVNDAGKKSMESIAQHLKITPPSATSMIAKMETKGLVLRERDNSDRRIVYIALSQQTKKEIASLSRRKEAMFERLCSHISEKDRKTLQRIIRALIQD